MSEIVKKRLATARARREENFLPLQSNAMSTPEPQIRNILSNISNNNNIPVNVDVSNSVSSNIIDELNL